MIKFKHILIGLAAVTVSSLAFLVVNQPLVASAESTILKNDVISQTGDIKGSFFGAGSTIQLTGKIDGDVYAAAQSVTISGDITGDALIAAQSVTISGDIKGDARILAQSVTITGDIEGSVSAAAQNLLIDRSAKIGRDLTLAVQFANIDGEVKRDLHAGVNWLTIGGSVGRDVKYSSDQDVKLTDGSSVGGEVSKSTPKNESDSSSSNALVTWLSGVLYAVFAITIAVLLVTLIVPRLLTAATNRVLVNPGRVILPGLIAVTITPVVIFLLITSLIGIPLAIAVIFASIALMLFSVLFTSTYIGRLIFKDRLNLAIQGVIGGLIYVVLLSIPLVNILVWIIGGLVGVGSIISLALDNLSNKSITTKVETKKPKSQLKTKGKRTK